VVRVVFVKVVRVISEVGRVVFKKWSELFLDKWSNLSSEKWS
jgi:hypothetical protein